MKLIDLVNSVEALNKLSETKLSAAVSFKVASFMKAISSDIENFQKIRNEKLVVYGTEQEDKPGFFNFTPDNAKKFQDEITELGNTEVIVQIPEIFLIDLGDATIEPKYLLSLTWLIKE